MLRTASSLPHTGLLTLGSGPGPFPDRAASLLPGLPAATRTGLPPAGDDELTNTKKHHGITSRCHLPFCWAHEKTSVWRAPVDVTNDGLPSYDGEPDGEKRDGAGSSS